MQQHNNKSDVILTNELEITLFSDNYIAKSKRYFKNGKSRNWL